jgi:hypothetical protein
MPASITFHPAKAPKDPNFEIRRGTVPGLEKVDLQGHGILVSTSYQPAWAAADTYDGVALYDTPNATVELASSNANDTSSGTGARTVLVSGYNGSNVFQTDTYTLAGQTVATGSAKTWKVITGMTVLTVGSGDKNAGSIWAGNTGTFSSGVPTTKYGSIAPADTIGKFGVGFVQTGHQHWVNKVIMMIGGTSKFIDVRLYTYDGIQRVLAPFELGQGDFVVDTGSTPAIAAGSLYWFECEVNTGTADVVILGDVTDETL